MKHKISKFKIKSGKDANKMLLRKLVRNFVDVGYIKTSETKAKYLRSKIESFVHSALDYNQAIKNQMLPFFITEAKVLDFVEKAKKHAKNNTGSGSVKMRKLGARIGDAANMVEVVWTHAEAADAKVSKSKKKEAISEIESPKVEESK